MWGGVESSDCDASIGVVRSTEIEVFGVPEGATLNASLFCNGRRLGESGWRTEFMLRRANDFRGDALRRARELLVESKLPCDMPWRHVMMRSFGGCVETLSLRDRLVRDNMLLGRPIFE